MIEPLNDAVARGNGTQIQIRIAVGSRVLPLYAPSTRGISHLGDY